MYCILWRLPLHQFWNSIALTFIEIQTGNFCLQTCNILSEGSVDLKSFQVSVHSLMFKNVTDLQHTKLTPTLLSKTGNYSHRPISFYSWRSGWFLHFNFEAQYYDCIPGRKSGILRIQYGHAAAEISFWTR